MIVTEQAARTKWCPHARTYSYPPEAVDGTAVGGVNRGSLGATVNCTGSACMAWRWSEQERDNGPDAARTGFCGLAYSVRLP